jgi:hypothetical protein
VKDVVPLDWVEDAPCPRCGCVMWVVDGDGRGKWWLLCLDYDGKGCVETRDLPSGVRVVE